MIIWIDGMNQVLIVSSQPKDLEVLY